jgi:serine/threonine-protein kinase
MDQMLDLPAAERAQWVRGLTGAEAQLAPQLLTLLQTSGDTTRTAWMDTLPKMDEAALYTLVQSGVGYEDVGDEVGPYRLVRLIARGGMGSVWYAERSDRLVRRGVALKLPLGNSRQLAARFEREREIVAGLVHPHIARLYDAGVAESGQAYLALEYVEGQSLDVYCDRRLLGLRARIALFAQVLSAVQYAHSRLVIHRDIKPSNILVTNDGEVRLLDFGVAKLLDAETPEHSELTQLGDAGMTLAYASPEQVAGRPVTTATDVYSLGVVLYELLVGTRPYRARRDSRGALEDAILQADIPLGSALVATQEDAEEAAAARGSTLKKLRRDLQGDLDAILLKALSRKPQDRYETAASFADDLERYRNGHAVRAHRRSRWYQLQKFVGRNRVAVGATLAAMFALATATGVALFQAREAQRQAELVTLERDRALAAVAHREAVDEFMSDLLLEAGATGKPVSIASLIARADTLSASEFEGNPEARAAVLKTVAEFKLEFDGPEKSLPDFRRAGELLAGSRDAGLRTSVACSEALLRGALGETIVARRTLQTLAADESVPMYTRSDCYGDLAQLALFQYDSAGAGDAAERALRLWDASTWRSPLRRLELLTYQAEAQILSGQPGKADAIYASITEDLKKMGRDRGTLAYGIRNHRIDAAISSGDLHSAMAFIDESLAILRQDVPDRPPPMLTLFERSFVLARLGNDREALAGFDALTGAGAGQDRRVAYLAWLDAAVVRSRMGQADRAEVDYRQAIQLASVGRADFGPSDELARYIARARLDLRKHLPGKVRVDMAAALKADTAEDLARAMILILKANAELETGALGEAAADARDGLSLSQKLRGDKPYSAWVGLASSTVAQVAYARGDLSFARKAYETAVDQLGRTVDATHPDLRQARARLQELRGKGA